MVTGLLTLPPLPVNHGTRAAEAYATTQQGGPQRVAVTIPSTPGQVVQAAQHHYTQHQSLTEEHHLAPRTLLSTARTPSHPSLLPFLFLAVQ